MLSRRIIHKAKGEYIVLKIFFYLIILCFFTYIHDPVFLFLIWIHTRTKQKETT